MNFSFLKNRRCIVIFASLLSSVIAIVTSLIVLNSKSDDSNTESVANKPSSFNFELTNIADYKYMLSKYDSADVRYFESQGKLEKSLYETTEPKVIWIQSVFAVKDTVFMFVHDTAYAEVQIKKIQSYWLEDQVTTPFNKVTLKQAIESINKVDIVRPKSKVFVIRRPLYPPFPDHNYYIFGDFGHTPFIQVDSNSGEVKICQF